MPKIAAEEVARIREEADIVEIISDYIPLTQRGKNFFGVCPFHQDNSPSMSVSREKQMFKCFSCGAAGNVFKSVSEYENISYMEAIEKVASKIGLSIKISDTYKPKEKFAHEYEIMTLATSFYQNNLNTEAGLPAKKYLLERGLTEEMIKEFNIEEILEIYTDITEDNIDEYLEEGTYDVANAFQFLDMVNSRLSETASLVMVKTMMIDRELEERKVS